MSHPACYSRGDCHVCESERCYFDHTCPHCGAELWLNMYDENYDCPECGGKLELEEE